MRAPACARATDQCNRCQPMQCQPVPIPVPIATDQCSRCQSRCHPVSTILPVPIPVPIPVQPTNNPTNQPTDQPMPTGANRPGANSAVAAPCEDSGIITEAGKSYLCVSVRNAAANVVTQNGLVTQVHYNVVVCLVCQNKPNMIRQCALKYPI